MMRESILAVCVLACVSGTARGGDLPGDEGMHRHLAERAAALEAAFLPGLKSAADFEAIRPRLREEYFHMLGLWPLPERTPLEAKTTGVLDQGDYVVELVHYQSRPHLYVTGNLYRPKDTGGRRLPAILYVCGHSASPRNGNKVQFQDHGIWFAKHGYVCLAIDTLQLGEIAAIHHGTYREGRWWWHSAGYTPAGVECWNGTRGIDYLVSRADVDPDRIGVTGISGGGAATFWIAAADERVKAAVPVSGMADLTSYVGHDVVNGHCDCMFLYNTFRWNWTEIASLVCPRPLLFMNSDADTIFPMDANERVAARLEWLYARFGAGDRFDAVVSVGGHAYRQDLRRAAFRFMNTYLKGDARPVEDSEAGISPQGEKTPLIPFEKLRVFPTDADLPRDELNTRIDRSFVARAVPAPADGEGFDAFRGRLIGELDRVSFGAWPQAAPQPIVGTTAIESQPGIQVTWREWKAEGAATGPAWVVVLDESEARGGLPGWAKEVVGAGPALLVSPRGVGETAWTRKNPPNTVERSLVLLGETADSGRAFDVLQALRHLKGAAGAPALKLAGRGGTGLLGAYAALHEPAVGEVILVEPPASHAPGADGTAAAPAILNVLRVLDVPDALGLLAPRRLTLRGVQAAEFERTRSLYERAGAVGALTLR